MKQVGINILIVLSGLLASFYSLADEQEDMYQVTLTALESTCPDCAKIGEQVLAMKVKYCGSQRTRENLLAEIKQGQIYAYLMALNSVYPEATDNALSTFEAHSECSNESLWIENVSWSRS